MAEKRLYRAHIPNQMCINGIACFTSNNPFIKAPSGGSRTGTRRSCSRSDPQEALPDHSPAVPRGPLYIESA